MKILVCNVGSTSLKFKLYEMPACEVFAQGAVERVGSGRDAIVSYNNNHTGARVDLDGQDIPDYQTGIEWFLQELTEGPRAALSSVEEIERVGFKATLASCLQETIENYWCDDAATSPLAVQNKLDRLNREFDRLLLLNGDEENVFLEKKLQKINNEILSLKQEVKYTERQNVQNRDKMDKLREVMELLSAENMEITEYSDVLVCRLIEQITVLSKTEIRIRFVGGYEVEQKLLI